MKEEKKKTDKKTDYNSDLTKEDEYALGAKTKSLRTDGGQDTHLRKRTNPVDFEGKDLDIPGREQAKPTSEKRLNDEENRHHSLGSSQNSNLKNNIEE